MDSLRIIGKSGRKRNIGINKQMCNRQKEGAAGKKGITSRQIYNSQKEEVVGEKGKTNKQKGEAKGRIKIRSCFTYTY
jgi:hypothetical protein